MKGLKFGICPTEGGHYFREALAEVERAEALGLDSVWLAEHHGVRDHYWPAPIQMLTALAARTSRITLGANVCVFPFYHPVRLAEETALLDVVSNGRAVLGVAIGYKPDEFLLYDAALEKRGARFEEGLALMKALWTRDGVTHRGEHFTVMDGRIEPKPVQRPHPPLWIGGWGDVTLRRAALLADAWLPGPTADLGRLLESQAKIREHRRARRASRAGRVAGDAGALPRRDGARGARARRPASHARLRQGVRGDLEASVHRRGDGGRPRPARRGPVPDRDARSGRAGPRAVRPPATA